MPDEAGGPGPGGQGMSGNNKVLSSYVGLDLIRFAAAMLVLLYHLTYYWWLPKSGLGASGFQPGLGMGALGRVLAGGWVGVPIFFVLSGFVIAFSASDKTAHEFVIARAARLYPAAWICASITALVLLRLGHGSITGWLGSMALSPVGPWISGVYWTLGVEIVFYTMVAALLASAGSEHILTLGATIGLASTAYWLVKVTLSAFGIHFFNVLGPREHWPDALLLSSGCYFGLGVMLWASVGQRWTPLRVTMAAACVFAGAISIVATTKSLAYQTGDANLVAPLMIWLVAMLAMFTTIRWNDVLGKQIGPHAGAIRTIGLMTYPLYLVHSEVGRDAMLASRHLGAATALASGIAAVLLIAYVVVKIEPYPRRLILSAGGVRRSMPVVSTLP